MDSPRFVVGIDLGTTHCAIAMSPLERPRVRLLEIPQLIAPREVAARTLLPSFLYLPTQSEAATDEFALPWSSPPHVVGELARRLGAKAPTRLVASAKSWVCHGGVNRRAPILPWNAPDDGPHISPFAAEVAFLEHLRAVWDAAHPDAPLVDQDVIVTVPASFDEGARTLTSDAAEAAGLGEVRLIEEPQAAFYDFLGAHAREVHDKLGDARLILVVDIGGGTTDLTLLRVARAADDSERPALERIAVGGHLMLGGDNMDAALAQFALQEAKIDRELDASEWSMLVQSARQAKERLLGASPPEQATISFQARGSRLVGGTRSISIERDQARRVLLDGFLPYTTADETANRSIRAGLTTLGLPYATDAAIGRHICSFLRRHAAAAAEAGARVQDGLPRPDLVLLNGGVFNAPAMVERLASVLGRWYGEPSIPLLDHTSLETAVASGATRFGLARRGLGEMIKAASARAYYIGVAAPAGGHQALCVAPRSMEEGAHLEVPNRVFDLVINQPVSFPLFAYTGDRVDDAGATVPLDDELEPTMPLHTVLRSKGETLRADGGAVPVTVSSQINDRGALELYLVTVELPPRRWKLEFSLANDAAEPSRAPAEVPDTAHERIADSTERTGQALAQADPAKVKSLRRDLEAILGPRGEWSAATCRALWQALIDSAPKRSKTALHELNWLRLCGWCLRPGFGVPGDPERIDKMWQLHDQGLSHRSKANAEQWWIMWRRIAGGLDRASQLTLFEEARPYAQSRVEVLQALASFERLPVEHKELVGKWFLERAGKIGSYWVLGRVGARSLWVSEDAKPVSIGTAETWLRRLLELDWNKAHGAPFAAATISARTNDITRDVAPELREEIVARLVAIDAPGSWVDMVRGTTKGFGDLGATFGESLPVGLRLV